MNGKDILKQVEAYKEQGAHLLLQTENISDHTRAVKPMLEAIHLSADPDDRDVYPDGDYDDEKKAGKFRIAKNGLMKLSIAAGIIWHPTLSGTTRLEKLYIAHRVVGAIRKPDGSLYPLSGQYDIDFEVLEDETKFSYEKKARRWKSKSWFKDKTEEQKEQYISDCIKRDLLQKRKFKAQLCETGAYSRVIRGILPGLKNAYTVPELKQPFVIVRYVHVPDYNDPEVRRRLVDASIQATLGIYGPAQLEHTIDIPAEDVTEVSGEPREEGRPEGPEPSEREVFEGYDRDTRIRTLEAMAKMKGYDLDQLQKPFPRFTDNQFMQFYDMLAEMTDADSDDIPW